MPNKVRAKWRRPFNWPPSEWEFTPGMQKASEVVTMLLFLLVLSTIVGAIFLWPFLLFRTITNVLFGSPDEIRNTLLAVGALVGVPFLIWRTTIAAKQTDISRESHYTALFTKAVEQLGADKVVKRRQPKRLQTKELKDEGSETATLEYESYEVTERNYEVRLGAIYALERIAQDSKRDAWPIYLTLCSYIANNAPPKVEAVNDLEAYNTSDIVEIFQVLCRYSGERDKESAALFQKVSVPKMSLFEGALREVVFADCLIVDLELFKSSHRIDFFNSIINRIRLQGNCEQISFNNSRILQLELYKLYATEFLFDKVLIDDLYIEDINCNSGNFQFGVKSSIIINSKFIGVNFSSGLDSYSYEANFTCKNVVFERCNFEGISFTNKGFLDCKFQDCNFKECNLIGLNMPNGEKNNFENCFDEDALKLIEPSGVSDIFGLLSAWREFRQLHKITRPLSPVAFDREARKQ